MTEYVNNPSTDITALEVVRNHSRCCCKKGYDADYCRKFRPVIQICCLQCTREYSGKKQLFVRWDGSSALSSVKWAPGDECGTHVPGNYDYTNLCGVLVDRSCFRFYSLRWTVQPDGDTVRFDLAHLTVGTSTIFVGRDWYLSPLEFYDPWYTYNHYRDPVGYPLPLKKMTFENCEVPTVIFPCDEEGYADPECDPGCWPDCVMCPERKNLYLVIDDDPLCCLAGTYELTWTGTGTSGSYSLATPTGTSTASCGLISAFTVTCASSTSINVSITYRVIYAPSISAVTENYTLSVACVDGHMESETVSYTLSGDQDGLCGSGSDYGGTIRVVSD